MVSLICFLFCSVLTQCQDVDLSFPRQPEGCSLFNGTKRGTLFLTSYRVIFVTSHAVNDPMFSFMMPFELMSNCTIEQPVFAANFIKGIIQAAPDGGWEGQATFKLSFRKGGAIEFAQLMMKAASAAYPFVVYGPPQAGYGPPEVGYGPSQAGYGPSQGGYGQPPGVYGIPPAGYGALPAGNEASASRNEVLPAANEAPPPRYEVPLARNRVGSGKYVVPQPSQYDTSLPPASSSEARPPSSLI
uniref:WBP2 N-terminal like n=1 Tax=Canis lupus familiaris TaxID=9615 RepID=A0A8P0S6Z5_CANLF